MAGVFNGGKLKRHAPNTWDESVREEKGFGTLTSLEGLWDSERAGVGGAQQERRVAV